MRSALDVVIERRYTIRLLVGADDRVAVLDRRELVRLFTSQTASIKLVERTRRQAHSRTESHDADHADSVAHDRDERCDSKGDHEPVRMAIGEGGMPSDEDGERGDHSHDGDRDPVQR